MNKKTYTYLALGDSYTIGESVSSEQNFPNQTAQLLAKAGYAVQQPVIIAKTGWTTDELQSAINSSLQPGQPYDIVSLLIGVNNQYRGSDPDQYAKEFGKLLEQAIHFAGEKSSRVFVLSIPDWGVTPYAAGRDRNLIGREIDRFNQINKKISTRSRVSYLDITNGMREAAQDVSLVASDGLHPSAKEYERWAERLAAVIQKQLM